MKKTPESLRAEAGKLSTQARDIWTRHNGTDREHSNEELTSFDDLTKRADALLAEADALQRREDAFNAAEARNGQSGGRQTPPLPHEDDSNTRDGLHMYSLLKALRQSDTGSKDRLDGLELETHQELLKRKSSHRNDCGTLIPWNLKVDLRMSGGYATRNGIERRDLTTTTGTGAVMTTTMPTMIELLRVRTLLYSLGAKVLNDMQGNFVLPRQTGAGTAYWINPESATVTKSNQTIDNVAYTPKTLGAQTVYSRNFLHQTSVDAEMFVREDLATVVAIGLDNAGFSGSGSGSNPTGIVNDSTTTVVAINTNGGAPTWPIIANMEKSVEVQNALLGNLAYVTSPAGRYKLKTTVKDSNTAAKYLWDVDTNSVNGYPAFSTNQISAALSKGTSSGTLTAMIFGNFADALFAFWGGLDTIVNPFTGSNAGAVEITLLQDADFHIRHGKSFAVVKDLDPA